MKIDVCKNRIFIRLLTKTNLKMNKYLKNYIKNNSLYYKNKNFIVNSSEIDINYFYIPKNVEVHLNTFGFFWCNYYQKFIKNN